MTEQQDAPCDGCGRRSVDLFLMDDGIHFLMLCRACWGKHADFDEELRDASDAERALVEARAERDKYKHEAYASDLAWKFEHGCAERFKSERDEAQQCNQNLQRKIELLEKYHDADLRVELAAARQEAGERALADEQTQRNLERQLAEARQASIEHATEAVRLERELAEARAERDTLKFNLDQASDALVTARMAAGDDELPFLDDTVSRLKAQRDAAQAEASEWRRKYEIAERENRSNLDVLTVTIEQRELFIGRMEAAQAELGRARGPIEAAINALLSVTTDNTALSRERMAAALGALRWTLAGLDAAVTGAIRLKDCYHCKPGETCYCHEHPAASPAPEEYRGPCAQMNHPHTQRCVSCDGSPEAERPAPEQPEERKADHPFLKCRCEHDPDEQESKTLCHHELLPSHFCGRPRSHHPEPKPAANHPWRECQYKSHCDHHNECHWWTHTQPYCPLPREAHQGGGEVSGGA